MTGGQCPSSSLWRPSVLASKHYRSAERSGATTWIRIWRGRAGLWRRTASCSNWWRRKGADGLWSQDASLSSALNTWSRTATTPTCATGRTSELQSRLRRDWPYEFFHTLGPESTVKSNVNSSVKIKVYLIPPIHSLSSLNILMSTLEANKANLIIVRSRRQYLDPRRKVLRGRPTLRRRRRKRRLIVKPRWALWTQRLKALENRTVDSTYRW